MSRMRAISGHHPRSLSIEWRGLSGYKTSAAHLDRAAPRNGDDKGHPATTNQRFATTMETSPGAKDSSQIYFVSAHIDEPYYELPSTDIYSIPLKRRPSYEAHSFDMGTGSFGQSGWQGLPFTRQLPSQCNRTRKPDLWVMDIARMHNRET